MQRDGAMNWIYLEAYWTYRRPFARCAGTSDVPKSLSGSCEFWCFGRDFGVCRGAQPDRPSPFQLRLGFWGGTATPWEQAVASLTMREPSRGELTPA